MRRCLCCSNTFLSPSWTCPNCGYEPSTKSGFPCFAPEFTSDEGFKDAYFHELVNLEDRNFWFRARNKLILWALGRYFPCVESLLEIGCGTGFVLSAIAATKPRIRLSGSEISSAGLVYADSRLPETDFFQMDARAIPFEKEFDVIGAFDVLEHIDEDHMVLNQMYQAIRPGGGVIVTVPQHDFLWSSVDEHACHVRRYDARELVGKVVSAGFKVERMTSFVSLLLPLMMASRLTQPSASKKYDPLAELRIGGLTNAVLEKVMEVEILAIRAGLNFPVGGSILLVGKK